jgi:hypothetical protein
MMAKSGKIALKYKIRGEREILVMKEDEIERENNQDVGRFKGKW